MSIREKACPWEWFWSSRKEHKIPIFLGWLKMQKSVKIGAFRLVSKCNFGNVKGLARNTLPWTAERKEMWSWLEAAERVFLLVYRCLEATTAALRVSLSTCNSLLMLFRQALFALSSRCRTILLWQPSEWKRAAAGQTPRSLSSECAPLLILYESLCVTLQYTHPLYGDRRTHIDIIRSSLHSSGYGFNPISQRSAECECTGAR